MDIDDPLWEWVHLLPKEKQEEVCSIFFFRLGLWLWLGLRLGGSGLRLEF